jgi:hypothetical protein
MTEDEEIARVDALADELLNRITNATHNDSSHVAMAALALAVFDSMFHRAGIESIQEYVDKFMVSMLISLHTKGVKVDGIDEVMKELRHG